MESHEIESVIEGILFVSGEPVALSRIAAVLGIDEFDADAAVNRLRDMYSFGRRGIRLVKLDNTVQLCSSPEYADQIRLALESRKPPKLSQPSLEVLAAIAYFQPVTRAYIEQLRGVDSTYTVSVLLGRGLIEACGRLEAPGRPVLYRTTHTFLRVFGLESLRDLPELPQIEASGNEIEGIQGAIIQLRAKDTAGDASAIAVGDAITITADDAASAAVSEGVSTAVSDVISITAKDVATDTATDAAKDEMLT